MKYLKNKAMYLYSLICLLVVVKPAVAGQLTTVTAESFASKIVDIVQSYGMPLGGSVVLVAVIIGGAKMLGGAYSPEKRKEAMGGLGYVLLGAILIGGSMFVAGLFWGVGSAFQ